METRQGGPEFRHKGWKVILDGIASGSAYDHDEQPIVDEWEVTIKGPNGESETLPERFTVDDDAERAGRAAIDRRVGQPPS